MHTSKATTQQGVLLKSLAPLQEVEDREEDASEFSGDSDSILSSGVDNFLNQGEISELSASMRHLTQEGAHTFSQRRNSASDISQRRNSASSTYSVTERASIIDSINWLGRHVPQCVIKQLTNEVMQTPSQANICHNRRAFCFWRKASNDKLAQTSHMKMPHGTQYEAAFLFIDMSGFTKLSQKLTVDNFSKAINSYFQNIVDEVISYGGDILKFAGDAIFIEWRVGEEYDALDIFGRKKIGYMKLEDCVYVAAVCGAMVVKKCADHPVYSNTASGVQGEPVAALNVHCGLGVGKMSGIHVGNDHSRRLYLVIGETIDQVADACDSAKLGEIWASEEALKYLNKGQPFKYKIKCEKDSKSKLIASKYQMFNTRKSLSIRGLQRKPRRPMNKFAIPVDDMNLSTLRVLRKMLSLYVHPVVVADENNDEYFKSQDRRSRWSIKGSVPKSSGRSMPTPSEINIGGNRRGSLRQSHKASTTCEHLAVKRHESEAELRSVFTIFIKPNIEVKLTDDPAKNSKIYNQLNDIMYIVSSVLEDFKGQLCQFILDDKGVVLIGTFGLRGSTFPNMVSERALPACRIIHSVLENELSIESQIGATLGKVYCGIVGGVERNDFSVLGASVNLAARLMTQNNHPGIMVDEEVRLYAKNVNFESFPPVEAKGYSNLVPVYKPLTTKESRWGKVNPNFVGRKVEMAKFSKIALGMSRRDLPSKMIFIQCDSGVGKSSLIVQAIAEVRKSLKVRMINVVLSRNVCADGDNLVPFR